MTKTKFSDLTPAERAGFQAFIRATNDVGGVEGYRRLLEVVVRGIVADHGEAQTVQILKDLIAPWTGDQG